MRTGVVALSEDGWVYPEAKLRWQPFVGMAALAVAGVIDAVSGLARAVASEFFADANYADAQETFMRQAALEIESVTSGVVPLFAPVRVPDEDELDEDDDEWDEDED